jgi:hypothetical protein
MLPFQIGRPPILAPPALLGTRFRFWIFDGRLAIKFYFDFGLFLAHKQEAIGAGSVVETAGAN